MRKTTSHAIRNALFAALTAVFVSGASASALADEPKIPQSPEDHIALARGYQETAASYRKALDRGAGIPGRGASAGCGFIEEAAPTGVFHK